MVIGYHLIFTAYGWWLPNDPRGSCSHLIRNDIIADLGELHHGRKRIQPNSAEIRAFYEQARSKLKHELRTINQDERALIACGFARTIRVRRYTCYACAVMPDHVHLLIRKHRDKAEQMIEYLQEDSRVELIEHGMLPRERSKAARAGRCSSIQEAISSARFVTLNGIPCRTVYPCSDIRS